MIVTLKQKEIELAIKRFLAGKLGVAEGMNFDITFAATRGDNGLTATVDLEEADEEAPVAAPKSKPVVTNPAPAVAASPAASPIAAAFAPVAKAEEPVQAVAEPVAEVAKAEEAPASTPVIPPTKLFG